MKKAGIKWVFILTGVLCLAGCGDSDESESYHPIEDAKNVIYAPGDTITYKVSGHAVAPDGATTDADGSFRIDVVDEGLTDTIAAPPVRVLTMVETQAYTLTFTDKDGNATLMPVVGAAYRYFTQDENGTILFYGDTVPSGASPTYFTVWFQQPWIQVMAPYEVGSVRETSVQRFFVDEAGTATLESTQNSTATIEERTTVPSELGTFESFKVNFVLNGQTREQHIHPKLGIIKFKWPALQGYTGTSIEMVIDGTNMDY